MNLLLDLIINVPHDIYDIVRQTFCKHKYTQYNTIGKVDGLYKEHWLICMKCSHHKIIKFWRKENDY